MLLLSSVRESSLHIFLMSVWAKWLFSFINRSHCISSTHPVDLLPFAFVWIFETMSGYRSPALNAGHAFIYPLSKPSFVLVQMKYSQLRCTFSFCYLVCWALIAFESDATGPFPLCVLCCESVPRFFDSLSVRLMFQKADMCAPCNAVFTEPPHQVSAHCIHCT